MKYAYQTKGVCSTVIHIDVEDGKIESVSFENGCEGNLIGISMLVVGMKIPDVIAKLEGIRCGMKLTSCPDQLCQALHQMVF